MEARSGTHKLYRGHYFIVFYDKDDTHLLYMFDNVREILKFQKKPITRKAVNLVNVEIYKALKTDSHITRFLTGEQLRIYIIDLEGEEDYGTD